MVLGNTLKYDYYPFGMVMPGRSFTSTAYRYGFNGMEKDFSIHNMDGTHYTSPFMEYDPRIARRWELDPMQPSHFPDVSPYSVLFNSPIRMIDPSGLAPTEYKDEQGTTIKDTKDGVNRTVTVKEDDRKKFDIYVKVGEEKGVIDNKGYNDWMTQKLSESSPSTLDLALAGVGTSATGAEILSKRILDSRSGYTSGKIFSNSPMNYSKATANNVNVGAKGIGFGLTAWSIWSTESQFRNSQISSGRRVDNHLKNAVGIAFPLLAIPIAAGDYAGQKYEPKITNSVTQQGGILHETTKFMLRIGGVPSGEKEE